MPSYTKEVCDAVIASLDGASDSFQKSIKEVFCKMDEAFRTTGNDCKKAAKLGNECRNILVLMRLFPLELQIAMHSTYKKTFCGFLSVYLDFKMVLFDSEPDKVAYFNEVMTEIMQLLGPEDRTSVWSVVVTSHILNRIEILRLLTPRCIEETKNRNYNNEEYIRMIWVLHVFFSKCKKADIKQDVNKVLDSASKIKPPPGLCKWMCHHFSGYGWKGLSDASIHEALVREKQPKTFFKRVYQAISKDDTLKYNYDDSNGTRDEDSSSVNSEVANPKQPGSKAESLQEINDSPARRKKPDAADSYKSNERDETDDASSTEATKIEENKTKETGKDSELPKSPEKPKTTSLTSFLDDSSNDLIGEEENEDDLTKKENKKAEDIEPRARPSRKAKEMTPRSKEAKDKKDRRRTRGKVAPTNSSSESSDQDTNVRRLSRSKRAESVNRPANIVDGSETEVEPDNEAKGHPETEAEVESAADKEKNQPVKRKSKELSDNEAIEGDSDDATSIETKSSQKSVQSSVKKSKTDSKERPGTVIEFCGDLVETWRVEKPSATETEKENALKQKVNKVKETNFEKERRARYAEDTKLLESYVNGPHAQIFEKFESENIKCGTEPVVVIEKFDISHILAAQSERETLADLLLKKQEQKKKTQTRKRRVRY